MSGRKRRLKPRAADSDSESDDELMLLLAPHGAAAQAAAARAAAARAAAAPVAAQAAAPPKKKKRRNKTSKTGGAGATKKHIRALDSVAVQGLWVPANDKKFLVPSKRSGMYSSVKGGVIAVHNTSSTPQLLVPSFGTATSLTA